MESKCSHFWIGLGLGSIFGAVIYRCSRTSKAKQLKDKVAHAFHKAGDQAEDVADEAKNKVMNAGEKVADKVADKASDVAGKADDMRDKMHNFADNAKK